jgi:hypothetical protein
MLSLGELSFSLGLTPIYPWLTYKIILFNLALVSLTLAKLFNLSLI